MSQGPMSVMSSSARQNVFALLGDVARADATRCMLWTDDGAAKSYGDVLRETERLSHLLSSRYHVRAGDLVAIHLGNTPSFCVAVFAILRLGAVVVPINTKLQSAETAALLSHAAPKLVIGDGDSVDAIHADTIDVVDIDAWARSAGTDPVAGVIDATTWVEVLPSAPAFVMYTSGTTGAPKGVILTHANVRRACDTYREGYGLRSDDRTVIAVPIFHGTGLFAQLMPFVAVGGGIVLQRRYDTERLIELIEKYTATHFIGVPTMHTYLLERADITARAASLRIVGSGGAPLPAVLAQKMRTKLPGARLYNTYGLTETTSPATMLADDVFDLKPGSIGLPTPTMSARIVREGTSEPCGVGEIGELCLAGGLVSTGYLDNSSVTAAAFEAEWFRTGDLAFADEEGYLYLRGRIKDMINRGGEKVYPIEVEDVLTRHPAVSEANVFAIADPTYGEIVAAQIVPLAGASLSVDELRAWSRDRLAKYKIPAIVDLVADIPKNASGKPLKPRVVQ